MVKLIDFWAPWCIDPQTPVLTENGYLKASQIKVGQRLITIDPKTYKQSVKKVQKIRVFTKVPSKKIILETGRNLIADLKHLVLTQEGFKTIGEIKVGEKVLVHPVNQLEVFDPKDDQMLLQTTNNEFSDKYLKQQGLLPLRSNDYRLPILARILGFVITDGYLYEDLRHNIYETHFFVGTELDAQMIKKDLEQLGFDKLEIKRQVKNRKIGDREFTIRILRCRSLSRALFFLLKALGAPVGRKKNQTYFVPDWIADGELAIKRSFMSGWLGGDGCKIDYYIKHDAVSSHHAGFKVNAIEFHKEKDLEKEGVLYAKQLAALLEDLGVETGEVSSTDDDDGVIISLKISANYPSLLNLSKIGYAYATTKNSNTSFISEFLQYRLQERDHYVETKKVVLQQLGLGVSNQSIAQNLQIPVRTVVSWRYTNKDAKTVHPSLHGQALFTEWLTDRRQNELIWEKVVATDSVDDRDVYGITVGVPHTLVTNGIISHNCGPCKIMNPVIEELEEALRGKVEFEKVNVDEESDKASEFGVMSIPTFVILKDGKEIARKVGVTSKEELLKLLQ